MLNAILIYFSIHIYLLLANSIQNSSEMTPVVKFHSLTKCISKVGDRDWRPTIVVKVDENQTESKSDFTNQMVETLSMQNAPYFSTINVENITLTNKLENYILVNYFDNSENLLDFDFDSIKNDIKYLWILENYSEEFWKDDFQCLGNKVGKYHVTIFMKLSEVDYKIVSFIPFIDEKTCTETFGSSTEINTCEKGTLKSNTIFPSKTLTNWRGCPFKVGLGQLYPYVTIENEEPLETYDSLKGVHVQGMEVDIVKIIAEHCNATLELHYINIPNANPYDYSPYLPFLLNGSMDAVAGGLPLRLAGDVLEYSGIYGKLDVCWFYTVDRPTLTWDNFIVNLSGLYIFIIFYIAYTFAWYIICLFDKDAVCIKATFLYGWGALVGTNALPQARSLKQKILNLTYLIMCLHVSVYIGIKLYSFFTIRGPPEIFKTNEDIMNSGRTPWLNFEVKDAVKEERHTKYINSSSNCSFYEDCYEKTLLYKGVSVILEGHMYEFQAATIVNGEARILRAKDNIIVAYAEMMIGGDSLFIKKIQKSVIRLFDSGITVLLFEQAIGILNVAKAKNAAENIMAYSYSCQEGCSIGFEQISGAFYLWVVGIGLAIIMFILEFLFSKAMRNKILKADKIL